MASKRQAATNSAAKLQAKKRRWWKKNALRMKTEVRTKPVNRYNALKARAKRERRKFAITFRNYVKKLKDGCYYCGANLMIECGGNMDRRNNDNPNYVARNLVGCCSDCNKIKSDRLTEKEMLAAMRAVKRYRKSL